MVFLHFLRLALVSTLLFTSASAANSGSGSGNGSGSGTCTNPRVRREWRSISQAERVNWLNAVKCLTKLPHNPGLTPTTPANDSLIPPITAASNYYDDWTYTHMDLNVRIHGTGYFLPWHRMYLQTFENTLRSKCGYNGVHPYWDWTKDAADFEHATIFSNSTVDGLGSWGVASNDFQINTGYFQDVKNAYPVSHYIRRNFTLQPFLAGLVVPGVPPVDPLTMINTSFTASNIDYLLGAFNGNYTYFQQYVEGVQGPHAGIHIILGGDMSGLCPFGLAPPDCYWGMKWSTNDPIFYLHHGMIDKVWAEWQSQSATNAAAFGGGSVSVQVDATAGAYPNGGPPFLNLSSVLPSDGLWGSVTVQDVMSTTSGPLCYTYA